MTAKVRVLFVCMGNICRSPTAHGVFNHRLERAGLSDRVEVDSAGTHGYHIGKAPDARAQTAAAGRGYELGELRARQVVPEDFEEFDYVLAMDRDNHLILEGLCPAGHEDRLHMFLSFAPDIGENEVPDPYFGGDEGFERVLDMVEAACDGLIDDIRARLD